MIIHRTLSREAMNRNRTSSVIPQDMGYPLDVNYKPLILEDANTITI